jgi:hypothetical protein
MAKKAKFKRVAVAGQTTDGRTIAPEWLTQAAKNYNHEKYGARVNLEHFRSIYPDSAFRAYGDVRSVYAEEVEIDGEKKMALFAEIDPTEDLIKLTKARQKVYTSIELDLDFAGTGEAYLVGLAVTAGSPQAEARKPLFLRHRNRNRIHRRGRQRPVTARKGQGHVHPPRSGQWRAIH